MINRYVVSLLCIAVLAVAAEAGPLKKLRDRLHHKSGHTQQSTGQHGSTQQGNAKPPKQAAEKPPAENATATPPAEAGASNESTTAGEIAWADYQPRGAKNGPTIYQDVLSRGNAGNYPDAATRCHESTHVVDSKISNAHQGSRGFYVGGGKMVLLSKPNATLSAVAQRVTKYRNDNYQLYLVKAQQWYQHDPLEVLEEFNAYCNDMQCQRELKLGWQGTEDRLKWFAHWADCLIETVKEQDPGYRDMHKLVAFVDWTKDRATKLIGTPAVDVHTEGAALPHRNNAEYASFHREVERTSSSASGCSQCTNAAGCNCGCSDCTCNSQAADHQERKAFRSRSRSVATSFSGGSSGGTGGSSGGSFRSFQRTRSCGSSGG